MNNELRWKQRFQNFERAFSVFHRRVDDYNKNTDSEAYQMALVQGFEMLQELSWKVLKDYLENEGYEQTGNARQVFRTAFQADMIPDDAEVWMNSIKYRHLTSHTYNDETLTEVLEFINDSFYPSVRDLYHRLKKAL